MTPIDITTLTAQKLANGEYRDDFPAFYELKGLSENGLWHNHQDIFDHVLKVYTNLERELTMIAPSVQGYLQEVRGNHTRESIVKIATLLHDIAKKETLTVSPTGQANCPGHEHIAAGMVKDFATTFNLDTVSLDYVECIVLHHGFISDILTLVLSKPDKEDYFWSQFTATVGDVAYELLLLMVSDLNGCDLATTAPNEYEGREKLLRRWLVEKIPTQQS